MHSRSSHSRSHPLSDSPISSGAIVPLLIVLAVALSLLPACSSINPAQLAWDDSLAAQSLEFSLPGDSIPAARDRAIAWLDEAGAERTTTSDWLVEAPPTDRTYRIGYSVRFTPDGERTTVEVRYDWKPRELYEYTAILTPEARARELAHFIRTGASYHEFARDYRPDSATTARASYIEERRATRVWAAGGSGDNGPWGEVGVRHEWFGLGLAFIIPEHGVTSAPPYVETSEIPEDADSTEIFGGEMQGLSLLSFYDLRDDISLYGSIGAFVRTYKELVHSPSRNMYFLSEDSPTWHDGIFSAGAGVQVTLFRHLVITGGYATATGWGGGIGVRF
jgi:hypothetical protein